MIMAAKAVAVAEPEPVTATTNEDNDEKRMYWRQMVKIERVQMCWLQSHIDELQA